MAKSGAKAVDVDFSNVKERGNFNTKRVDEGDYLAVVTKVEDGESKKDGEFQYIFTIKLSKFSQYAYPYYCKLTENQLWKLRNLLVAAGMNVPKRKLKLDPNKIVGKQIGVTMEDDEYEGKEKSTIAAVFPAIELDNSTSAVQLEESTDDEEDFDEGATPATSSDDDDTEDEAEAEAEEEAKPKKKKDKGDKKGKKKKGENLEELDISDV